MKKLIVLFLLLTAMSVTAQDFELSAELRPRYENKHGFSELLETDAKGTNFVSQRTRLNFDFSYEKFRLQVQVQNIRVWGDVSTLASDDTNIAFHTAWAEYLVSDKVSFQFGRQEIDYDDSRIFGNVEWAQQARSHDALVMHWNISEKSKMDVGFAYNADNQSNIYQQYSNAAGYKAFQYAWYHTNINNGLGLSVLALNTGVEYERDIDNFNTDYSQTIGSHITYKKNRFISDYSVYIQTGKSRGNSVSTSNFAANFKYKITDEFTLGAGGEYLSGKAMNDTSDKIKSFNPLFGTNHKFNGWMDYFYVGNHAGSVGLIDINTPLIYSKNKLTLKLIPHFFSAAADVYDLNEKQDDYLGTEIDFTIGYKVAKNFAISGGHSRMFATESMEIVKGGGDHNENNSWTWVMLRFNPTLFKSNIK